MFNHFSKSIEHDSFKDFMHLLIIKKDIITSPLQFKIYARDLLDIRLPKASIWPTDIVWKSEYSLVEP